MLSLCGRDHRQVEPLLSGTVNRNLVTRIRMTHHAGCRVVVQDACDMRGGFIRSVTDDDHARVLGEAHPHAAAVV